MLWCMKPIKKMFPKTQLTKLQTVVLEQIAALEEELVGLEKALKIVEPDCSLCDLTREEELATYAMNAKIFDQTSQRLAQLRQTLTRIEDEGFGICSECDEPIAFERLLAAPHTRLCIECAKLS